MEKQKHNNKRKNKHGRTNWAARRKKANNRNAEKKERGEYDVKAYNLKSTKFDLYYRTLLDPILDAGNATTEEEIKANKDKDFAEFCATLKEKLPITFRVNPLSIGFETVTGLFSSDTFIRDW